MRQILHLFASLLERQTMIGKVGQGKGVAGILQLAVELSQQGIGLRHAVEIAGGLFRLDENRIFAFGPVAGLRVRAHQMQNNQLRLGTLGGEHLLGQLQ